MPPSFVKPTDLCPRHPQLQVESQLQVDGARICGLEGQAARSEGAAELRESRVSEQEGLYGRRAVGGRSLGGPPLRQGTAEHPAPASLQL